MFQHRKKSRSQCSYFLQKAVGKFELRFQVGLVQLPFSQKEELDNQRMRLFRKEGIECFEQLQQLDFEDQEKKQLL